MAQLTRHNAKRLRRIVTPEGIALPIVLASRATRFGALVIDFILLILIDVLIVLAAAYIMDGIGAVQPTSGETTLGFRPSPAQEMIVVIRNIAMFMVGNGYFMFFELGPRGATPGKRITGMRIAARDGGRLTAEMVIARNLIRDIELFLPAMFLLVASLGGDMGLAGIAAILWFLVFALFPFFNKDRLRAGDLIAGTWVVEAPKSRLAEVLSTNETARSGASQTTGAAYRFGEAELAVYGEYELQTLERVLRENRAEAIEAVHTAICTKIGWNPGAGDERAFLEAYYTQLRARLESGMRMGKRKADKWAG